MLQISELLKYLSVFMNKRGMSYSQRLMGSGVIMTYDRRSGTQTTSQPAMHSLKSD